MQRRDLNHPTMGLHADALGPLTESNNPQRPSQQRLELQFFAAYMCVRLLYLVIHSGAARWLDELSLRRRAHGMLRSAAFSELTVALDAFCPPNLLHLSQGIGPVDELAPIRRAWLDVRYGTCGLDRQQLEALPGPAGRRPASVLDVMAGLREDLLSGQRLLPADAARRHALTRPLLERLVACTLVDKFFIYRQLPGRAEAVRLHGGRWWNRVPLPRWSASAFDRTGTAVVIGRMALPLHCVEVHHGEPGAWFISSSPDHPTTFTNASLAWFKCVA